MRALGNSWCFRTFFMVATYQFGWSPEVALKCDPDRYHITDPAPIVTHAMVTDALLDGSDPDDLDKQCATVIALSHEAPGLLELLYLTLDEQERTTVQDLAKDFRASQN